MKTYTPVFCTIITGDHIHYALTVRHSLLRYNANAQMYILLTDVVPAHKQLIEGFKNVFPVFPDEVCNSARANLSTINTSAPIWMHSDGA